MYKRQGRHLGHERARVVHHLLGRDEDRRRARHGQHLSLIHIWELWQKGLCIPCLDTACDIAGEDCTETVTALMQLAPDVQCPYAVSYTHLRNSLCLPAFAPH